MSDKNVAGRIALIVLIVTLAAWAIWPPSEWSHWPRSGRLKGGIDLVGGTSLLYEIDTSGLAEWQKTDLAERVMSRLKNRVDPQGQRNLVWRPMGQNRLEIQMPRPPKELAARRQRYENARDALRATRVDRAEIEAALNMPPASREASLMALVRGVPVREELFRSLLANRAKLDQLLPPTTRPATQAATTRHYDFDPDRVRDEYLEGITKVLNTNINLETLGDILALGKNDATRPAKLDDALFTWLTGNPPPSATQPTRSSQIEDVRKRFPAQAELIAQLRDAYDLWAATKGPLEDASDLMRLLRGQGVLEFRILAQPDPENRSSIAAANPAFRDPIQNYIDNLAKYGPRPRPNDNYRWFKLGKPDEFRATDAIVQEYMGVKYVLAHDRAPDTTLLHDGTWSLKRAIPDRDRINRPSVSFTLDPVGGRRFERLTAANLQRPLCILLDNVAMSAPNIQSAIRDQGQITGDFTQDEIIALCNILEAGSLDARLKETPLSIKTVGPSLGERNRQLGLQASVTAFAFVVAFMAVYYLYGGAIADIAVMLNLLITVGIMALIQGTFTLQGIAGLILTLGMAVDANVLIFERLREEQDRGISLRMAMKLAYERAFWPIFDSNLTTIITAIILGYVGTEEIKGFALTLGLGLCVSMFTALFVTRQFFAVLVQNRVSKIETQRCWGGTAVLAAAAGVVFAIGALFNRREAWSQSNLIALAQFLAVAAASALVLVGLVWTMRYIAIAAGSLRTNRMPMLSLLKPPKVDWMHLLKYFWPLSAVGTLGGLLLFALQPANVLLDIEFLGGTGAQITVSPADPKKPVLDAEIEAIVKGEQQRDQAAGWIVQAASLLENAAKAGGVARATDGGFTLRAGDLTAAQLEAILLGTMEDKLVRNGITAEGDGVRVQYKDAATTEEQFQADLLAAAEAARRAARNISTSARVQSVEEVGAVAATDERRQSFEVVVTETNKKLVGEALLAALGEHKDRFSVLVERAVAYDLHTDPDLAPDGVFPIRAEHEQLGDAIGMPAAYNIVRYKGGAAMVFDKLTPPQTLDAIGTRLRQMRLQPDYEKFDWRENEVFGLTPSGETVKVGGKDVPTFSRVAIVVNDPNLAVFDNEAAWRQNVAEPELKLAQAALSSERSLDKVTQFAPQVASQAAQQAAIALILSLIAMIAYLWFRFGTMEFGLGAIIALIHDVSIALGCVSATHWVAGTPIGNLLGLTQMRIDLALVAAFLTIVGFSVNDTIVIFDRIRENRGRLGILSPQLINASVNQTLPRTILTSFTVFLVVAVLYVLGGPGVHSFAFAMMIGTVTGTYSSFAIAAPILYRPAAMRGMLALIVLVATTGTMIGTDSRPVRVVMAIFAVGALALLAYWQYRSRGARAAAAGA